MNSRIKRIFIWLLALYSLGGAILYFIQDMILFHPKPLSRDHQFSFHQPFEEINIPFGKGNVNIVKFKPATIRKGLVLFYHGNMENVEHYKKYPAFFLKNGYELWMIDYPGFGKTTGKRTEKNMMEQAMLMYDLARKQTGSDSLIIYGKSIGTGVASYVASIKNCRRLILETPYYSIPALARHYFPIYPVHIMIKYSFPIHKYLPEVKAPVSIFHGTDDEVVPYTQSIKLKKENTAIGLITIEKGKHNDLSNFTRFQSALDSLLQH